MRRTATEIKKDFYCPYLNCNKAFGSEGSMNLHIKLKHAGGNKTDRERIAKDIILDKLKGNDITEKLEINLPPGSVEKAAETIGVTLE